MARSQTVWVVTSELYRWPAAVFTVKHELKTWLESRNTGQLKFLRLWSYQDGGGVYSAGGRSWTNQTSETPRPVEVSISEVLK